MGQEDSGEVRDRHFLERVEQFLKERQEDNMDPPQIPGRLIAGKNVLLVHNWGDSLIKLSRPGHPLESLCVHLKFKATVEIGDQQTTASGPHLTCCLLL